MGDRKENPSVPTGNVIIYPLQSYPIKLNFSSSCLLYKDWSEYLKAKGSVISKYLENWYLQELFKVKNWQEWKKKYKRQSEQIDNFIKKIHRDELGLGIRDFAQLVQTKMEEDLKIFRKEDEK